MYLGTYLGLLAAMLIIPILSVTIFLKNRRVNGNSDVNLKRLKADSPFLKKHDEVEFEKYRSVFFLLGICISLGMLLLSFNFLPNASYDFNELTDKSEDDSYIEIIPNTNLDKKKEVIMPKLEKVVKTPIVIEGEDPEPEPDMVKHIFMDEDPAPISINPGFVDVPDEKEVEPEFFIIVEDMPEFPGGIKEMYNFLYKQIRYPKIALSHGIEGEVFVEFIVNRKGQVKDFKIVEGIGGGCDEEVLKAISKLPDWEPGAQRGKKVNVKFTIPIIFKIP